MENTKSKGIASGNLNLNHNMTNDPEHPNTSLRRRLPRSAKKNAHYKPPAAWDPDVPSDDPYIKVIERLNQQTLPHNILAEVDDIAMKVLFMSKAKAGRWAAVTPELASNSASSLRNIKDLDRDTLLELGKRCRALTHPEPKDDLTTTVHNVVSIFLEYASFQDKGAVWEAALKQ